MFLSWVIHASTTHLDQRLTDSSLMIHKVGPGVVAHIYHPSTQEVGAGGTRVQGQPWLHSETLSQINK
jgi:hypothetical protein